MAAEIQPAAEFQALPLEFIVAAPLTAAVKAQIVAAQATRGFIEAFLDTKDGKKTPTMVEFDVSLKDGDQMKQMSVKAPLLSIVPVPHLRIDSLTVHFRYEISQTVLDRKQTEKGLELSAQTGPLLSPWASASLKGSISTKSSEESTVNRSGSLEVTLHASEAEIPEGLARVLTMLAKSIEAPEKA